jgi:hypothetical protein
MYSRQAAKRQEMPAWMCKIFRWGLLEVFLACLVNLYHMPGSIASRFYAQAR